MEQDFSTYLPPEITINILSRLPIQTIITCKCVCKSWLELLETDEFVTSHLSISAPGLAVLGCKVFQLEDGIDLERHELHYNPVAEFDHTSFITWPNSIAIQGSANGLILLWDVSSKSDSLYVCNPITREYTKLHSHHQDVSATVEYGFGVSKMSGQHKVVRISHEYVGDRRKNEKVFALPKPDCRVYTLGSGAWRSTESGPALDYSSLTYGVFMNGKIHWLASDLDGNQWISVFDLETEHFTTLFPTPGGKGLIGDELFGLRDCLCVTDYSSESELAFWLMKEYGVEKSWTKEFVISRIPYPLFEPYETVYPIKFFENGDVLMACEDYFLFYYSIKTKTTHRVNISDLHRPSRTDAIVHTPSFLSLKSFGREDVKSF